MIEHKLSKNVWYGRWSSSGRRVARVGCLVIDSRGVRRIKKGA